MQLSQLTSRVSSQALRRPGAQQAAPLSRVGNNVVCTAQIVQKQACSSRQLVAVQVLRQNKRPRTVLVQVGAGRLEAAFWW